MGTDQDGPPRLRVIMFSAMRHEITAFEKQLASTDSHRIDLVFVPAQLDRNTVSLAQGARAICLFPTDHVDAHLLGQLRTLGVQLIALRSPGVSSVDIAKAAQLDIQVARIPTHPHTSIAEYTIALMLALNRKVHLAANKVREGNMSLQGLVGFELSGATVGVVGTGKVGRLVAKILRGFDCKVLACDVIELEEVNKLGVHYVSMGTILESSDIISLHAPLVPGTYHMIDGETLPRCKKGVHIINTSRGGLIDIRATVNALRSGQIGGLAMDVYEGEAGLFFKDHTGDQVDEDFQILRSMSNVLITGHLSALTTKAVESMACATVKTLLQFLAGEDLDYGVKPGQGNHTRGQAR
eukprot:GFKZ01008022.1.p1 GENE.GFKZ01008022.1~~GFKZ01008022.1.p1  ORF type:complete len:354 (+),score=36.40 GFKZ01008022.1:511-1572(+)